MAFCGRDERYGRRAEVMGLVGDDQERLGYPGQHRLEAVSGKGGVRRHHGDHGPLAEPRLGELVLDDRKPALAGFVDGDRPDAE